MMNLFADAISKSVFDLIYLNSEKVYVGLKSRVHAGADTSTEKLWQATIPAGIWFLRDLARAPGEPGSGASTL